MIQTARRERRPGWPATVLFIDEVHRFSKTQQDSLLARRGGPDDYAAGGDHGEPIFLGHLAAAVPVRAADSPARWTTTSCVPWSDEPAWIRGASAPRSSWHADGGGPPGSAGRR